MRTLLNLFIFLFITSLAFAQIPPTGIKDEGGAESKPVFTIDCVGAGKACTHSGSTATLTVSGGGGAGSGTMTTVKEGNVQVGGADQVTIDFGACFDVVESPDTETNITFDSSECTVNSDALKANGANCPAGQYAQGVDASGAAEGCTALTTFPGFTDIDTDYGDEVVNGSNWSFLPNNTGANDAFDLTIGTVGSYGGMVIGNTEIYSSSFSAAGLDLDKAMLFRQNSNLGVGNDPGIEFAWMEQGNTVRMLIPESGSGNATALIRSVTIAGPYSQVTGNDTVLCDTWSSYNSNIDCDTSGTGADLFVQDDLEIEGEVFLSGTKIIHFDSDDASSIQLTSANATADRTVTIPDETGTVITTGASEGILPDGNILEADLKVVDAAADEECLTYEATGGDFEWQSCGGGGSGDIESVGSCLTAACFGDGDSHTLTFEGTTSNAFEGTVGATGDPTEDVSVDISLPADRDVDIPGVEDNGTITAIAGQGYSNLLVEYVSATAIDVDADYLVLRDSNDVVFVASSVNETCTITTSGINGLEASDTEGASKWYEVYIYAKEDGTVDCLLNEAGTAVTTTPTDYVYSMRVGSQYNDSSSNLKSIYQRGNFAVNYEDNNVLSNGSATTLTNVDCSTDAPPTAYAAWLRLTGGSAYDITVAANGDTQEMTGHAIKTAWEHGKHVVSLDSSQIFDYKNSAASKNTYIAVIGYWDNL